MADMIPVGNTGTPPLQSLASMISAKSGMIGLQQQQQTLQTGQYQQATAQAESQQAQQKNQELQALAKFTTNAAKDPSYQMDDGSPDIGKYQQGAMTVAPTYGQEYIGHMTSNFKEAVGTRQALQTLSATQNDQIAKGLQGLANIPGGATRSDLMDWKEQLEANNNDPRFKRAIDNATLTMTPDPNGGYSGAAAKLAAAMSGSSMQTAGTIDTGPNIQPVTTTTMGPGMGQVQNAGAPIAKAPGPTQTIPYVAAAAAAGSGAGARATGVAGSDIDRANQVSANVKSSTAGIQTTQQIDDLSDQIHSGKYASWLSKQAAAVGVKEDTYARQLLEKDLGIVRTQLTAAAPSDARAATILSGTPDATSDPQTIHGAMDYVRGSMRQNVAQGQNLNAYRTKHPDLSGFQGADDSFTSGAGPLMHEFLSLKDKDSQAAFYRRNFKNSQEALQFRNQAYAASHTLSLDNGNR